jgi:hypothetical protein
MHHSDHSLSARTRAAGLAVLLMTAVGCAGPQADVTPHVDHVTLSPHKVWKVISVQRYKGLEEVELVRVDWPTATEPSVAFALTREGLDSGDPICLDHIVEIDTLWAHPVPEGGCQARP